MTVMAAARTGLPVDDGVRVNVPNRTNNWRAAKAAEIAEETEWLISFGYRAQYIMDRLHINDISYLNKLLKIAGREDLVLKLTPVPKDNWIRRYAKTGKL